MENQIDEMIKSYRQQKNHTQKRLRDGLTLLRDMDGHFKEVNKCLCGKEINGNYKQCYGCFTKNNEFDTQKVVSRICTECKRPLVTVGNARKNGKNHRDWNTRSTHKKCYKENFMF